ncbi:MAG: hypothetical protein ACPIOQ_32070 [Promethearchaeia archaeon]
MSPADELMALIDNLATRDGTTGHLTTACRCVSSLASRCSAADIEAFMRSGGTSALTSLLKSRDEEVVDAAAAALADLSAPASRRPQERVFELQGVCVRVRELEFSESGTQRARRGRCDVCCRAGGPTSQKLRRQAPRITCGRLPSSWRSGCHAPRPLPPTSLPPLDFLSSAAALACPASWPQRWGGK